MTSITKTSFGTAFGREASVYILDSGSLRVGVTDFGASITGAVFRSDQGREVNTVLRYDSVCGYADGASSIGATVGRCAGRIGGAAFSLDGKRYELEKNDGENHLHGGFAKRFFTADLIENGVSFSLVSPDGDEGFPGALRFRVDYTVEDSVLRIVYEAEADASTVFNPTNHSYFNLNGRGNVNCHLLKVFSDEYLELGPGMIPTGRILSAEAGALDFSSFRRIGRLPMDNSFVLHGENGLAPAAELVSKRTGIGLRVRTTRPSVHIYTGDYVGTDPAGRFPKRGGVCFETQHYPDSPNKPCFPSAVLRPGEKWTHTTEYEYFNF